jgi:hypothetical protein
MERVHVFEVDLPSVQEEKKKRLHKHFGRLPQQVTFLPIDFDKESLEAVFTGTAFDSSKPSVFVWEGVRNCQAMMPIWRRSSIASFRISGNAENQRKPIKQPSSKPRPALSLQGRGMVFCASFQIAS